MLTTSLAPLDETITIEELTRDPYPIYRRLRREAPVLRVKSVGRTFLTKAADTKYVKDNAALFSSDDPNTPMTRAFLAHTLMRKDHDEHRAERMAMMPALMPKAMYPDLTEALNHGNILLQTRNRHGQVQAPKARPSAYIGSVRCHVPGWQRGCLHCLFGCAALARRRHLPAMRQPQGLSLGVRPSLAV
jgi:cytochrome P450